jgi:homoserine O-succinyltransferase
MTVILSQNYHGRNTLDRIRVPWKTREDALREDIRALRIGILNIMPQADTYEFNLLQPMGYSVIQVEPVWIRLKMHAYTSTSHEHLKSLYVSFKESVKDARLDGLIITGAPVEEIPFEQISYWNEILRILKYARNNITCTLGICWGALAMAKSLGIDKQIYENKVFGVFPTRNLDVTHGITGGMGDVFWCPQSRHSGLKNEDVEHAAHTGVVKPLASSEPGGYVILESTDRRFLMHLGHPEYRSGRLVEEYLRDKKAGLANVLPPVNVDLENPLNTWRTHRTEFFSQWIKYIHETTAY